MQHRISLLCFVLMIGCAQGGGGGDAGLPGNDTGTVTPDSGPGGGDCPMTCPAGTICRGTSCVARCDPDGACEGGRTCCEGACVNFDNSLTDCGGCGMECGLRGNVCSSGACLCGTESECTPPEICCGGGCVEVLSNAENCGGCGMRCAAGELCEEGVCVMPPCSPACEGEEVCMGSECRCGVGPSCTTGACCGGGCVDTQTDASNCGFCGNACGAGEVCLAGGCTTDVPCEPACGPGETCSAGTCRCGGSAPCGGGQRCCDGVCATLGSDVGNCGACGRTCSGSESCCSGACVNTNTSEDHCGGCGRACDSDVADGCDMGSCTCNGGPVCAPSGPCQCLPPPFSGCSGFCI